MREPRYRLRQVFPCAVYYDPVAKELEVRGPTQMMMLNLDRPEFKHLALYFDVFTEQDGKVDMSPEVFGVDVKDFCDECGREDCVCEE